MEPLAGAGQRSLFSDGRVEILGSGRPAPSEISISSPGNRGVGNDGGGELLHGRANYGFGEGSAGGSSAKDGSDANEKTRPLNEIEDSTSRPASRGAQRESPILEEDELPVGDLQADHDFAEAGLPGASVGDGRPTERDTDVEQAQAQAQTQAQAAEVENAAPCKICFTNLEPQDFIYLNCGCLYCVGCLNDHFRSGLANKASYPPRCCDQLPIDVEAVQGFLDDENMIRYTTVQEEFAAERPLFCANKECNVDFIGDAAQINAQGDQRMVICYNCALETCAKCRELRYAHADNEGVLECPDSLALADIKEIAEEENWRRCPGCRFLVEKIDGCDHMLCDCRMEFHYICGEEYTNDGRCGCNLNHDWEAGEQDGQDGEWGQAVESDTGSEGEDLEDLLPEDVRDDLHRPDEFPFIIEQHGFNYERALRNFMEDTEILLVETEAEDDTDATTGTAQAAQEEVIDDEGGRHDSEGREIVDTEEVHDMVGVQDHQGEELPANRIEEESQNDEDGNLQTAKETLRTALAGFRNATGELRTAAAAVVTARRRVAERTLRGLQRADGAGQPRIRRLGRRGRGGRGRGRRVGAILPVGQNNENGEGVEQEPGAQ